MKGEFEARISIQKVPVSRATTDAMRHVERYDAVACTSKHAEDIFRDELRRRKLKTPSSIIRVGPRDELLKLDLKAKRILFPRSALAPFDIVRRLRAKGAVVRPLVLYTAEAVPLSGAERKHILDGRIKRLYFKSPSGVHGFVRQFHGHERRVVLALPARCIGATTAHAARKAGFRKVFIS